MQADRRDAAGTSRASQWQRTQWIVLGSAVAYFVLGRLSLLLGIPPSQGSAFWPGAGVALAALMIHGRAALLGVWLGAFAVNLVSELSWPLGWYSLVCPAWIASGATLQALVGQGLIRRFLPSPLRLERGSEVLGFFVLAGPLACLVSATLGTTAIGACYDLPWTRTMLFTWTTWWLGDTIGVVLAAPIVLTAFGRPAEVWRSRFRMVGLTMLGVIGAIVAFAAQACTWERHHLQGQVARRGEALLQRLHRDLDATVASLESVRNFLLASDDVSQNDFRTFGLRLLAKIPGLRTLAWCVRVPAADRAHFERELADLGISRPTILERTPDGGTGPAAARECYFPTRYAEPLFADLVQRGFDAASDPHRREAMERALLVDAAFATRPQAIVVDGRHEIVVWIALPICEPEALGTPALSLQSTHGFVLLALEPSRLLVRAAKLLDSERYEVSVVDVTDPLQPLSILPHQGLGVEARATGRLASPTFSWSSEVHVAGRVWLVRVTPEIDELVDRRSWQTWAVLVIGLLFTATIGGFLLIHSGHAAGVGRLVASRTADLLVASEEARLKADQLLRLNQKLSISNRELELFAYVASHDLKEPLRMVACFTGLLAQELEGKLGPDEKQHMDFAIDGAKRSQQLVDDLLTYARLGRTDATMESVDLDQVVSEVLSDLEPALRAAGAVVSADSLPRVYANRTQVRQLVQNLVANSLKFRGDRAARIEIRGALQGNLVHVSIRDDGIGIAPEYHERIFGLFQRLHSREEYAGTGIGLAVCKKIVDQHGGKLWVESRLGSGATFHFTLASAERSAGEATVVIPRGRAVPAVPQSPPPAKGRTLSSP